MAIFTPLGSSLVGTDADDSLLVAAGDPTISLTTAILARDGNDSLAIDAPLNATLINLNKGDDSLALSATATTSSIFGGGGNDILTLSALLSSEIRGGGGNDRITLTGSISGASLINGNLGDDLISASLVTNAVALSAGAGNDTLLGSAYADTLTAGAGSDSVLAADGDDLLLLGTLDPGEVINGGNGTNTLRWSSDAGIDFSIASLSAIQQLELAPGGSGDTYTIAQGLSSGSPLLITGGGIATGEADQLRIRQAASSGAFSLAQSAGGDLLTYTDAITGSPVTITFANSSGGSVRTEGGDLLYTSSTGGGGGFNADQAIAYDRVTGLFQNDTVYSGQDPEFAPYFNKNGGFPNPDALDGWQTEVEFNATTIIITTSISAELVGAGGDGINPLVSRTIYEGSFSYQASGLISGQLNTKSSWSVYPKRTYGGISYFNIEEGYAADAAAPIAFSSLTLTELDQSEAYDLVDLIANSTIQGSALSYNSNSEIASFMGDTSNRGDFSTFGVLPYIQDNWDSTPFTSNLI